MRFLLGLFLVNTAFFTIAKLFDRSLWWVVIADVVALAVYVALKTWFSRSQTLINQGAHMGWVFREIVRDEAGYRDALLERDGVVARVSWQKGYVTLAWPAPIGPHRDFVAVERALTAHAPAAVNRVGSGAPE